MGVAILLLWIISAGVGLVIGLCVRGLIRFVKRRLKKEVHYGDHAYLKVLGVQVITICLGIVIIKSTFPSTFVGGNWVLHGSSISGVFFILLMVKPIVFSILAKP